MMPPRPISVQDAVGQLLGPPAQQRELLPVVGRLDAPSACRPAHARCPSLHASAIVAPRGCGSMPQSRLPRHDGSPIRIACRPALFRQPCSPYGSRSLWRGLRGGHPAPPDQTVRTHHRTAPLRKRAVRQVRQGPTPRRQQSHVGAPSPHPLQNFVLKDVGHLPTVARPEPSWVGRQQRLVDPAGGRRTRRTRIAVHPVPPAAGPRPNPQPETPRSLAPATISSRRATSDEAARLPDSVMR